MRDNQRVELTTIGAGRSPFLTYEPYYGLKEKPFSLSADPRFLYKSRAHGPTFEALRAGIRRREGLIVLTGEPGTGKTTLCRSVLEALDRKTFCTLVPDPFVSRDDLLKMLLLDFGVMSVDDLRSGRLQGASRPELSYPLYEFLKSLVPLQAYAVLILDEAQNLSPQLLEEIRILSDLEAPEKLLQLVLVGQPELRTKLKDHSMRQVEQRVSVRVELTALDRTGVGEYIAHRLNVAGGGTDRVTFADNAVDVIFKTTKGNPRLINLVCDKALHHGHLARTFIIGPEIVALSLAELGMLDAEAPVIAATSPAIPSAAPAPAAVSPAIPSAPVPAAASGSLMPSAPVPPPTSAAPLPKPAPASAPVASPATAPLPSRAPAMPPAPLVPPPSLHESRFASRTNPLDSVDDFGLGEKFFDRPREATEPIEEPVADSRRQQLFMNTEVEPPPPIRNRKVLMALAGLAIIGTAAGVVWTWQGGPISAPSAAAAPAEPPKEIAAHIDVPTPDPIPPGLVTSDTVGQSFEVGVAVFTSYDRANRLAVSLAAAGFRATTRPLDSEQGKMYEVRTGPYLTREAADADAELIRKLPGYADARVVPPPPAAP